MTLAQKIQNQLEKRQIDYEIRDINFLPSIENMSSQKAYRTQVCALYVELRGSNDLDVRHWEQSLQLIHLLAIDPIHQILQEAGGKVVSIPGNGILALWNTSKSNINQAVKAALTINWLLKEKFEIKQNYPSFNYGIGIHQGSALAIKVQKAGGDFDEEVIKYISPVINIVQTMSNQLSLPHTVGISQDVYDRLYDETVSIKKSFALIPYQKNIWNDDKVKFNEITVRIKTSAHHRDDSEQVIAKA